MKLGEIIILPASRNGNGHTHLHTRTYFFPFVVEIGCKLTELIAVWGKLLLINDGVGSVIL